MLFSFVSGFKKSHLFSLTTIKNSKNSVSKNDVITINRFWDILQQKNEDIGFKFVQLLVRHGSIIYIPFLDIYKILDFLGIYFLKIKILILGVKKTKFCRSEIVCKAFNLTSFGVCWLRFTLKSYIPETFECWPIFRPEIA